MNLKHMWNLYNTQMFIDFATSGKLPIKNVLAIEVENTFLKKILFLQVSSLDKFSLLETTCFRCEYFSKIKENIA